MAVHKVIQVGHPSLREKNKTIIDFASPILKKLLKDLTDTMYKTELVGIAAPQIAENYLVFLTHPRMTKARKIGQDDSLRVFINPQIVSLSKEKSLLYEGCGSVVAGGIFGPVIRPKEITVQAFDQHGKKFRLTCDGLLAKIIQHEYDHLYDVTFIEKVSDYSKMLERRWYRKTIRNSKAQKEASKITQLKIA